jgi:hypothetical protein
MGEWMYIFLNCALAGGEWSASCPGRFTPGTNCIGGWVDPRVGLDDAEKRKFLTLPGLKLPPLGRPARSQSLHRLRYPGSSTNVSIRQISHKKSSPLESVQSSQQTHTLSHYTSVSIISSHLLLCLSTVVQFFQLN